MVECESLSVLKSAQTVTAVLIDTWWNVNMEHYNEYIFQYQVLIDTWWNVNKKQELGKNWAKKVLIDTWWNVNETVLNYALNGASGFNRYMVECEFN